MRSFSPKVEAVSNYGFEDEASFCVQELSGFNAVMGQVLVTSSGDITTSVVTLVTLPLRW